MPNFCKIWLGIICFISIHSSAQQIRNFQSLSGKKDIKLNCMTQSADGNLWLGYKEGLVKFDGKNKLIYFKKDGLSSNDVSALYFDKSNVLWIGHENGRVSTITKHKVDSFPLNDSLGTEKITGFYSSVNGQLYISSYGSGLFIYDWNTKKLEKINSENGLSDNNIYSMAYDGKQFLWLGTDAGITLVDLNKKTGKERFSYINTKWGLPDNIVRKVVYDGRENMLIAMQDSGVCYYNTVQNKIIKNVFLNSWMLGAVTDVISSEKGELIISTEKNGLMKIENGRIKLIDAQFGILSNNVNQLLLDRELNLWIASQKGLTQLFQQRHSFLNLASGLPSEKVTALLVEDDNSIWFSTEKGLYEAMLNETGNYAYKLCVSEKELSGSPISTIGKCNCNHIWLGTYGAGVVLYDPETNKAKKLLSQNETLNENISSIHVEKTGRVWIGTLGGGIAEVEHHGDVNKFKFYTEEQGLGSSYVYQVYVDTKGKVWCANDGSGLEVLQGESFVSVTDQTKLKSKTVYSISEDAKGRLWFTTSDDGVGLYDGKSIQSFGLKDGLREMQPPVIMAVGSKLVSVHGKGIDVLKFDEKLEFNYYEVSSQDIEPNLNAFHMDSKGNSWFGTNSGILKFRAFNQPSDTITPALVITSLKVQYKDFPLDSTHEFDYNQNNFMLEFKAVWLKNPDNIRYRFQLKGQDLDWQPSTINTSVSFSNLQAGDYEVLIQACTEEGVWSQPVAYKFTINKPLWHHWWFWVIVILISVIAIYSFIKFRIKALEKEKLILEQKVEERTLEIQEQGKVIEEKNKELEQLSLVASKTDNVVVIMDANGRVEYVNDSFVRLNKVTLDELRLKKGETIYQISNNPEITNIIKSSIENKQSVVYESLNIISSEEKVWESSTLTPIFDENGILKKLIIIDSDITTSKRQEEIILQKNKDITDSIQYARKIQTAILPNNKLIKASLPQSFVYYVTKDIVSGDFYWFADKDDFCIVATVDCTGHGVPGAFMSLIGYNILNQIVNEKKIYNPAEILAELNEGVLNALYRNQPDNQTRDGMDLAICKIWKKKNKVEFAGAMRPLWMIKNGTSEIIEIKADKIPMGTRSEDRAEPIKFTNHEFDCNKGDLFYISSDGYADQFGGARKKKFTTGRFKELMIELKDKDLEVQKSELHDQHMKWRLDEEQVDDILVIGFKI